jgi:hypothetical protein
MSICPSRDEFISTLFKPGGTADGFIDRVRPGGGIRVWIRGEYFTLNQENVFGLESKVDGRTWYSYGGRFKEGMTMTAQAELAEQVRALVKTKQSNNV